MSKYSPDLRTRFCRKCGSDQMTAHERRTDFLQVKNLFKCPKCSHEVALIPPISARKGGGALGVHLTVGVLATFFLSYILWGHQNGYSHLDVVKTFLLLALFTSPVWGAVVKERRYPVTGTRAMNAEDLEEMPNKNDPLQKGISALDGMSASKGFFGLWVLILLFLGLAAFIGWINFTYFDDNLFG